MGAGELAHLDCIHRHGSVELIPHNLHHIDTKAYSRGDWAARTKNPTPLGVIFHNTDLNHFGYSLDRGSVQLCENATAEEERDCFTNKDNERKFQWDNRHFVAEAGVVLRFINDFVLPMRMRPRRCDDLANRQHDRFVLYNVWCREREVVESNSTPVIKHYYRNVDVGQRPPSEATINQKEGDGFLPRCDSPNSTPTWNYYNALVDENAKIARYARSYTPSPDKPPHGEEQTGGRIPHRLIFTHKRNLFDCANSASATTKPELHNLAENAKATINAYKAIWPDLEYVFLTDDDCIRALNETEPDLIGWFNSGLEGMSQCDSR